MGKSRRLTRIALVFVVALGGVGGCIAVATPPAPVGSHVFLIGGMVSRVDLVVPMNPIATFLQDRPARAPLSVQVTPDGRTMYALFQFGACAALKSFSVETVRPGVVRASVEVGGGLLYLPCPAIGTLAATNATIDPAVDPATLLVLGPDGDEVPIEPYRGPTARPSRRGGCPTRRRNGNRCGASSFKESSPAPRV